MPPIYTATSKDLAAAHAKHQTRLLTMQQDNRALGTRLEGITGQYPHLNAATAIALAEAGYDKDSVEAKTVGNLQMRRDKDDQGWFGDFKDRFSRNLNHAKPVVRVATAAMDAPRETVEGGFRDLVHGIKTGTGDLSYNGVGEALGYQPIVDAIQGDHSGFNQSRLGAGLQVARETGIPVSETLNNLPQVGRDGDVTGLLDRKQSTWLPGPNSLAEKRQVANARAADQVGGRATTYGRQAGALVGIQPGGAANKLLSSVLSFGGTSDDDPRSGMTPKERAAWEAGIEERHGLAPIKYEDSSLAAYQRKVQVAFEGSIDAAATFTPLDPVGFASGAIGRAKAVKGFGGETVDVLLKNEDKLVPGAKGAVRAPEGVRVEAPSYHGTSAAFDDLKSVDSMRGHHNLYGPGFYTTESRDVAQSYTAKGKTARPSLDAMNKGMADLAAEGKDPAKMSLNDINAAAEKHMPQPAVFGLHWQGKSAPKLIDLDRKAPDALRNNAILNRLADDATGLRDVLDDPKSSGRAIYTAFKRAMGDQELSADDADELMHDLRLDLMDEGFDGFTHRGGHAVGAGYNHKVSIYFDTGKLTAKEHVRKPFVVEPERPPILVDGGTRQTVVFKNAHDWLMTSEGGDLFARYAAAETNYERLAHVLGRETNPAAVLRVLGETDPVAVKRAVLEEMGNGFITAKPSLSVADRAAVGQGNKVAGIAAATLKRPTARWRQLAPSETVVSRSDPAWAVEQYRRSLHSAKVGALKDVLTPEFISKNVEDFARGIVDPNADWSVPYKAAADMMRTTLVAHGAKPNHADAITAIWGRRTESERNYWVDRNSGEAKHAFVTVDGEDLPISSTASSAEMFTEGIPLLNTKDLTKAASRLSRLYQSPGWEAAVNFADMTNAMFKFAVLALRPGAFPIRNITEAQARIAVDGGDSVFTSPFAALAWRLGDNPDSKASRLLGRADRHKGRGAIDPAGDDIQLRAELEAELSTFARTQEHKGGPWNDDRVIYTDQFPVTYRNPQTGIAQEGWHEGQRFTLAKLAASPEYRMAVEADNPLHAKNMFWQSGLRQKMAQRQPALATREGADAYMDKVAERIKDVTNEHPDLRAAISTGRLNGVPLVTRDARGNMTANQKALDEIEKYTDHLPAFTVTPGTVRATQHLDAMAKGTEAVERVLMNQLFAFVSSMPNNRFVNSPLMRELTWKEAARLSPLASPEARVTLAANARKANMDKRMVAQFDSATGPAGKLTAEDVRDLAEAKAFDRWMHTVYNSHLKGNWAKSARLIGPFAAAIADMYRFWGKALVKNPLILHRVELGMHGARQSGFFYVDDNGEERFAYPFTRGLSKVAAGVDTALTGTVKGANMITSGLLPGVGPIVSWPTAWFLPDKAQNDSLRDIINPYGDPDGSGGVLEGLAPSNVQKILASFGASTPEQRRRRQEAIADTMAYLAATGDYGDSEDEAKRLRDDANRKGGILYFIQAFAQAGLPASPKADTYFKDPSGRAIRLSVVAADWRKFLAEDPDTANVELLKKHGEAAFLAVTGGTEGTQFATDQSHDLAREHPDVVEEYGQVWSFFTDPDAPYNHQEFLRQIKADERAPRSLKDRQVSAQTSQAWGMYHQYKDQFGPFPTTDERAYLKMVKSKVREQFPLWDESFNAGQVKERVDQAFAAAKDPVFEDSPAAGAVRAYETARDQVIADANGKGLTSSDGGWGKAKTTEAHRDYMRQVAASLIEQVPEFATFWDRVFSDEMIDDVEGQP